MALISTADLRNWMGTEEADKKPNAKLSSIAQAIEDFVDGFTNRKLLASTYFADPSYSYFDGTGRSYIYLPVYPVSYVSSVYIDSDREFGSASLIASSALFWYPSGKLVIDGKFSKGRRNIRVDYTAGFAPVVGSTHAMAISTYPIPLDLKQVMIEMCVQSFKEGMTAVHTVQSQQGESMFTQMLTKNSFWANVLNKYKSFDAILNDRDEE